MDGPLGSHSHSLWPPFAGTRVVHTRLVAHRTPPDRLCTLQGTAAHSAPDKWHRPPGMKSLGFFGGRGVFYLNQRRCSASGVAGGVVDSEWVPSLFRTLLLLYSIIKLILSRHHCYGNLSRWTILRRWCASAITTRPLRFAVGLPTTSPEGACRT